MDHYKFVSIFCLLIFLRAMIWYVSNLRLHNGIISLSEYFYVYSSSALSFSRFSSSSGSMGRLSSMICWTVSFKAHLSLCFSLIFCLRGITISNSALTLLCRFALTWARYGEQLLCGWNPAFLTRSSLEFSVQLKDVNTPL